MRLTILTALAFILSSHVKADVQNDVNQLKKEFEEVKNIYEKKIELLESKISQLEQNNEINNEIHADSHENHNDHKSHEKESSFNLEAVLNGKYTSFSRSGEVAPKGFGTAHEGERGREGLQIGESELIMNSDIGEKFSGSLTAAIVREDGADKIELEEAYVESLKGSFLDNAFFKIGRAFWNVGILNPQHAHADDFADRPLPYRVFLNKAYNDDGLEASYLLHGSAELGLGLFRGDDFPFGNNTAAGQGSDAWSIYYKSTINMSNAEEIALNLYHLSGKSRAPNGRVSNEDNVTFRGDSDLSIINLDYKNSYNPDKKLKISAEYFYRNQDGTFEDSEESTGRVSFDDDDSGYYIALVNQFNEHLSLGMRYSELLAADTPTGLVGSALDSGGNDPEAYSVMSEWKFDSAAIIRLQLNHEKPQANIVDNQIIFQYIMYLGSGGHDGHDH
ncbi:MAG: hypothetical protein CMJ13_08895 [Pelagibacterales bacterium]|mgnify:CR=1 FL=1|nr:hypothetical protein [Pelagibacterales bacterium]|tara:strand:- start:118 stop:1461 length:1344 start_codon:yes stop_codon:yes gene_type:complete